jgi:hypothetical protein
VGQLTNLIFCPVGIPIEFHPAYDKDNHWRLTKPERNYETFVYRYSDYTPPEGTYDYIGEGKGYKWQITKQFLDNFDHTKYEYIGFWDDDLVCDIQSVNRALEIAKQNDIKLFQLSTVAGSDSTHTILHQNTGLKYSRTNVLEGMGPFVHSSLIPTLKKFWEYHEVKSGWGFDLVMPDLLKVHAGVIHEVSMYHPAKPSYYDKNAAFAEMYHIYDTVFPKFMKDTYNEDCGAWSQQHIEYEIVLKGF